jgi:CO/xanthine dehydrogenase FAD-binding subunit
MLNITQYHRPTTVSEAVGLLAPGRTVIAGGTDLMVNPRYTQGVTELVDITRLGLAYIRLANGSTTNRRVYLGAATTMHAIEYSDALASIANGVLARAAGTCGSPNIRNVATIGGNICSALPSGDTLTTLLALDASVTLEGAQGQREVGLVDFFLGPARTVLDRELLVEISFQIPDEPGGAAFYKLGRTEEDISIVNAAAILTLDGQGRVARARIAAGAVAPTPLRAFQAEDFLVSKIPDQANLAEAARLTMEAVSPITDQRATADYRRKVTRVCALRALEQSLANCAARQVNN